MYLIQKDYIKMTHPIPETKAFAVERALQKTFNTTTFDSVALLTGGLSSALVYKIVVQGKPYVMRLIMHIDPMSDPARQFTCMKIAAESGVAPYVHYTSVEDALCIIDYIETVPLREQIDKNAELLSQLVKTVKTLHRAPLFPKLINFLDGIDLFIEQYKALNLLPESATEEHFHYYAEIQKAYPRYDPDVVSSHNDLNPNNILFDGKKFWFIDWEAAFENDYYADLANIAKSFVTSEAHEEVLLRAYFGDTLDDYKRARFFLMQQVSHMFYAMIFLKFAAAIRTPTSVYDPSMDTPSIQEFYQQMIEGKFALNTFEGQLMYGKVLLNEALRNMKTARFAESLDQVKHFAQ